MPEQLAKTSPTVLASRILIVDDSEVNRMFLEKMLKKHGFVNLVHAGDGKEAINMFHSAKPDLILLDLIMPHLDGFEVCEKIRQIPEGKTLPILVQTALTKEEERVKAFAKGATDFVSKPLFPDELFARVKVHLENRHYLRDLQLYKERVEAELAAARDLQYSILPQRTQIRDIEKDCGLEIAAYFEPSTEIGGDFWGIKKLSTSQVSFWVVDFSGHSVAAALNVFRLQAYLQEESPLADNPGKYLSMLNEKLLKLLPKGHFATLFYGLVDLEKNRLLYASAGSPHPLLLHHGEVKSTVVNATGQPLGISPHEYATQSAEFKDGESIFFYSDALIETSNTQKKFIDEQSLLSWLREITGDPEEIVKEMLTRFNRHAQTVIHDDLTMGMIHRPLNRMKARAYG